MIPTARLYETQQQAREAADELAEEGFPAGKIFVVTPGSAPQAVPQSEPSEEPAGAQPPALSLDDLAGALLAGNALGEHAEVYAAGVQRGLSLVLVSAAFGHVRVAEEILDRHGPVDTGLEHPAEEPYEAPHPGTPLSASLGLPVLSRDPAPLSEYLGVSVLSRRRPRARLASSSWTFSSMFGFGLLSRNPAPLSSMLGLGTISRDPAPLSSRLGLKTLSGGEGEWTSSFGMPLLSREPAPLSSMLGLPVKAEHR